jgi:hypothetical protein
MENSTINFDIFSQNITPLSSYILIGDKNPETEINTFYLNNIMNKTNGKQVYKLQNIIPNKFKTTIITSIYDNKKENLNLSDNKLKQNKEEKQEEIITKIHFELLPLLYSKGEYSDNNNKIELTKEQMIRFKLEKNNPFIFSFKELHPFSIFYGTKYDKLIKKNNELWLPEPNYIEKEEWCKQEDISFNGMTDGVKIVDETGVVIDSPYLKKKFSGIVGDIIFQILRVPFGHHISLNIKIFEPKTVLARYMTLFSFANAYLIKASSPNLLPYQRFKYIIAFLFGSLYMGCKQLKPFNPFLGETFEGEFPNGAKIYVENVTHKPLVARFLIRYKKKYEISGYWDLAVKTQSLGNEMIIHQKGPITVKFPEINEYFIGHIPFVKAINARSEEKRAMLYFGSLVCVDPIHNHKCFIEFNHNKKNFHEIRGCTMNYKFSKGYKFDANKEWEFGLKFKIDSNIKENQLKTKMNDNYYIRDIISGSFLEHLKIGDQIIWDINKDFPDPIIPVKYCIPSDGRFREDLLWLYRSLYKAKNEKEEEYFREIGMKWKVMMEEFNRWERKHRADYNEKLKKKY